MPCGYNCSSTPLPLNPDNDITGPGVIINCIATAGIAVFIIFIYYIAVYDPTRDPFVSEDGTSESPHSPNLVDVILLRWIRCASRRIVGLHRVEFRVNARFEKAFLNCFLAMSDLQFVTGSSTLISGFIQLTCGLTTFEWLVIVSSAWFASLTHLSCLTLMRNHLYNNPNERLWRLLSMGTLAIMSVVSLAFTANYSWTSLEANDHYGGTDSWTEGNLRTPGPHANDYAICFLSIQPRSDAAFWSTIVSTLLILLGFVSRVVKLHPLLSAGLVGKGRAWLSALARRPLNVLFDTLCKKKPYKSLSRTLIYRPLLAGFLAGRLLLSVWSSMLMEVAWLLVAFTWGVYRLLSTRSIPKWLPPDISSIHTSGFNKGDWTFGQVVSIVLLIAPIFTILNYFDLSTPEGTRMEMEERIADPVRLNLTDLIDYQSTERKIEQIDYPDRDWCRHTVTLGVAIIYAVLAFCLIGAGILAVSMTETNEGFGSATMVIQVQAALPDTGTVVIVALAFTGAYMVIIFSLLIETVTLEKSGWVRIFLHSINLLWFLALPLLFMLLEICEGSVEMTAAFYYSWFQQPFALVVYLSWAILYRLFS